MCDRPKILCVGEPTNNDLELVRQLGERHEIVHAPDSLRALGALSKDRFHSIYVCSPDLTDGYRFALLVQNQRLLDEMADGVVLLDENNTIIWANRCQTRWFSREDARGANFYDLFGSPDIMGPDFCPFHTALSSGEASSSTLRTNDNLYYQVHAAPLLNDKERPHQLIVTVRDVTDEILQQQKMEAIHDAGKALADLRPEEVFQMRVEERIELLKSNIVHYTKDLLSFDVVEIRLLDQKTQRLMPLLCEGMTDVATNRPLYSLPHDNGVTGFVAATGKSYLCEDTTEDPLYIEGCAAARSSLTVPLILHDQVIGTFNVESPEPGAFTESDMQFLEIFCRDVAVALNTLELLVAQQANTAQASVEAIHREVALPVDEILNDAVNVMERYIGHQPAVVERLQRILRNARDIKQVIHKVGQSMAPAEAVPPSAELLAWPRLKGRHVLVVDADEAVRSAAHGLMERYGCIVETAHEGSEAIYMVRSSGVAYDVIIADIRLPDFSGYQLLLKLQETLERVPLILMSSFGYDPDHSLVKARQAGLLPNAVLYKPFRLDQLLETVDSVIEVADKVAPT